MRGLEVSLTETKTKYQEEKKKKSLTNSCDLCFETVLDSERRFKTKLSDSRWNVPDHESGRQIP